MSGLNIPKISGEASTSTIRACSGSTSGIVLAEDAAVELCHRARRLDPGRAAADDDHVQRAVRDELRVAVGRLPALEHVILEPHGVGERVERERVLGRSVDAEEVDLRPEREHEVVVPHRLELAEAAPRAPPGRSRSRGPGGRGRCPARRRDRGSDGRRPAARAGRSRPGRGAAGRCGSRARPRARRRRRSSSAAWRLRFRRTLRPGSEPGGGRRSCRFERSLDDQATDERPSRGHPKGMKRRARPPPRTARAAGARLPASGT